MTMVSVVALVVAFAAVGLAVRAAGAAAQAAREPRVRLELTHPGNWIVWAVFDDPGPLAVVERWCKLGEFDQLGQPAQAVPATASRGEPRPAWPAVVRCVSCGWEAELDPPDFAHAIREHLLRDCPSRHHGDVLGHEPLWTTWNGVYEIGWVLAHSDGTVEGVRLDDEPGRIHFAQEWHPVSLGVAPAVQP